MSALARQVAAIVHDACCVDVRALKPGNVSIFVPGHRMTATDFVLSADAMVECLCGDGLSVGERIRHSVEATVRRVGCNTNLGIVLLLAPLVQALLVERAGDLPTRVARVFSDLDVADARDAYVAIAMAKPGGLGVAPEQDIAAAPTVTLRAAMALAADRDRIAFQYANRCVDIFQTGVEALAEAADRGWPIEAAATCCFLAFAGRFADSHIARKHGAAVAESVRQAFGGVESRIKACDNLGSAVPILLKMDSKLKAGGINPGTSADLTIASVAAWRLKTLL